MQSIPHISGSDISERIKFLAQVFGAKPADFVPRDIGSFKAVLSEPPETFVFDEDGLVLTRLALDGGQVGISVMKYTSRTRDAECFYFYLYQLGDSQRPLAAVAYITTSNRTCRRVGIPNVNGPLEFVSPQDARGWLEYMTRFFLGIAQAIE